MYLYINTNDVYSKNKHILLNYIASASVLLGFILCLNWGPAHP